MRFQLNLSSHPFPHYRTTNLLLGGVFFLTVAFSVWQAAGVSRFSDQLGSLSAREQAARVEWEFLGERIGELDERLRRPEALAAIEEVLFLNQLVERRRFSWTHLLDEIERIIPRAVYLVTIEPRIDDAGLVQIQMQVRGQTIEDLSGFILDLEGAAAFRDVTVLSEARGDVEGRAEIELSMEVSYLPETAYSTEGTR